MATTTVCVTGASGFIALHLVEQLLARGTAVRGVVRSLGGGGGGAERKLAPLRALQAQYGSDALQLVEGDLLDEGAFDTAVDGTSICYHTASPFWMDARISDPHEQLVRPAREGTLNVMRSCAAAPSVERVVLTSSFAALMNSNTNPPDYTYTEADWNRDSAPGADGAFPQPTAAHAYRWSKTAAERAAWDFTAAHRGCFDLVSILPPMVLGQNKQRLESIADLNQSSLLLHKLLSGEAETVPPGSVGFTDVADVARAHVLAAETAGAAGQRYLCSGASASWEEVAATLRECFPGMPVPDSTPGAEAQPKLTLANDKIKAELGIEFEPLRDTLQRQGDALLAAGLLA